MFERVLLTVDGSVHSERAIQVAGGLAKNFGKEVLVLNAREVLRITRTSPIGKEATEQTETLVRQVAERLAKDGVNARGKSVSIVVSGAAKGDPGRGKELRGEPHRHGYSRATPSPPG